MKTFFTLLLSLFSVVIFAQEAMDSTRYNIGYKIGENIPVALLMLVAIIFMIRGYRRRGETPEKTDFMNDGTIEK